MGDRGQIKVIQSNGTLYLYTHWDGNSLIGTVKEALSKKERWDDEEYLTRILFSAMIAKDIEGTTGFGIGFREHGDLDNPVITVDCIRQEVTFKLNEGPSINLSFSEFIQND